MVLTIRHGSEVHGHPNGVYYWSSIDSAYQHIPAQQRTDDRTSPIGRAIRWDSIPTNVRETFLEMDHGRFGPNGGLGPKFRLVRKAS